MKNGLLVGLACGALLAAVSGAEPAPKPGSGEFEAPVLAAAEREQFFQSYFDRMTAPKPLTRFASQEEWMAYRNALREKILRALGLSPLPERVPLDPRTTGRIDRDDLPQFAALIAPRPLWLNGAGSRFGFTARAYQAHRRDGLRLSDLAADGFDRAVPEWITRPN